ncbi:MAG: hypothetical protein ACFWT6_05340 [Virgibacillus proomii]|jgi:putative DeoR family transcriptional regulator, stage III sporulation protein D
MSEVRACGATFQLIRIESVLSIRIKYRILLMLNVFSCEIGKQLHIVALMFSVNHFIANYSIHVTPVSNYHLGNIQLREANGVHDYIKERTIRIGNYLVETRKTVRVIAKEFGVSKSTVHKDLTERLPEINPELASKVKSILEHHKAIRHLRGGEATRKKYKVDATKKTEAKPVG